MIESSRRSPWTVPALCWILAYQGYTLSINGIGAPFIARSFGLDDGGIASLYAVIASAAIGVLFLSRLADRVGRRRVVLACMAATPLAALAASAAQTLVLFAILDTLLYAVIGATMSSAVIMLTEALPLAGRARGQGYGGLATASGAGVCLILMPLLHLGGYSWRWLLVISGLGLATLPVLAATIPESRRWERAAEKGVAGRGRLLDVVRPRYRRRAGPILACAFLSVMAGASADAWSYYHAVAVVGLSATTASTVVLVGGGLGMVGFPLGAWACDRAGRVPTVVAGWSAAAAGALLFYWGPPAGTDLPPAVWLCAGFFALVTAGNAAIVGFRASSTELFPTALRGTMMGWSALIGAAGAVVAQATIALLATALGGLSTVVGFLALLAVPGAVIFGVFVDETRGLPLEVAAREEGP